MGDDDVAVNGPRLLVKVYRTAEDYRRYSPDNPDRLNALRTLIRRHRRYFGRSVLDLACGGGALEMVLPPSIETYLGVDANPDMIREARNLPARHSNRRRFVLGDVGRARITVRFDTIALLGNSLGHLTVAEMEDLLRRRAANAHVGSTFLVDYRDLVAMFWNGTWSRAHLQTSARTDLTLRPRDLDLTSGRLQMQARPSSGRWNLVWDHAIWSPFILGAVMRGHGWRLVRRSAETAPRRSAPPEYYTDVYRLGPRP